MIVEPAGKGRASRARLWRRVGTIAAVAGIFLWLRACAAAPLPLDTSRLVFGAPVRLSGVVHVHTNLSDGRGDPEEVIAQARAAGVDFLVVTDHNRVDPERFPERAGDPTLIVGSEVSTEAGHILAIGIRPPAFRFSGTLREVLDDIRFLGGCAFAAHPTSPRGETRFTRAEEPGNFGLEIVNGDTAWREASPFSLALAAWTYPANPSFALRGTLGQFSSERALWDQMLQRRFVPALAGTDAHGRIPISRTRSLPLPSYEALFSLARTVVYLKQMPSSPIERRAAIVQALCAGRSAAAIPSIADPRGFSFAAESGNAVVAGPGDTVAATAAVRLRAGGSLPKDTELRLLKNGEVVATGRDSLEYSVSGSGVFRAEAHVRGVATPWVMSNPISILSGDEQRKREQNALPDGVVPTEARQILDSFDGPSAFNPEHDPGSVIDEPILDPEGGRGRGKAARLAYHLSTGPRPPVWCALVDRTPRDLSAFKGLSFWARGDGEARVWVQIRDLNPRSADEGTEAWFASIRVTSAWTLYNIPFSSLRSINRTSDGSFDPSKVAHIVFVIDHGAMPFGSSGRIWFDDLGVY